MGEGCASEAGLLAEATTPGPASVAGSLVVVVATGASLRYRLQMALRTLTKPVRVELLQARESKSA